MEALNAVRLKPICGVPDQRGIPRKIPQIPTLPSLKFPQITINPPKFTEDFARKFHGSLLLLASSAFSANFAGALTYEEALEQSVNADVGAEFDAGSVVETIVQNPLIIAGGVAVIAVPLVLSQVFGSKPKPFGVQSAKIAYAKIGEEPNAQLLDIRSLKESREVGSPDIRGLKKKAVSIVYRGEDKPGFLQKLSLKFKDPENTTLYILDKFDGNSELVAELVTANGFKSAYAIKDGAEGPRGWMNSKLPWILPKKTFSLDFSALTEAFGESADGLPVLGIGAAAAAGFGLLAFTEMETLLQLLGSAAIVQLLSKKLLFAEDRKQTLGQLDEFLNTKVAPNELVSDIKKIGTALLPITVNDKALPAPEEAAPVAVAENSFQKTESVPAQPAPEPQTEAEAPAQPAPEPLAEAEAEAPAPEPLAEAEAPAPEPLAEAEAPAQPAPEPLAEAPAPEISSTPQKEVNTASHQRPLSPYAAYPDLKPPTSPCPSQP
ncbi:hypothetical protein SOVF_137670 [Spinacia oleracea]|uniref:Rhodanese-like domain-containing protein 4, chloroplastic n=1 Tax=Spinacia oleracea TaxID=3562 RepID=A0A9R0IM48_SPIOL|nr:rhodanese-like domain-containing protein 4, chloroplastic [Spinacia oleracea]KNA11179.1 hypothetical protein SOVF_137670 [Spinacia oleracea]